MAAGEEHTLILKQDGSVWATGKADKGKGHGFMVQGLGFKGKVAGLEFRVTGLGFRVRGLG